MKSKNYIHKNSSILFKPFGLILLNILAFVFIFTSFSNSYSKQSFVGEQPIKESSNEILFFDKIQLNKFNADSILYFEGSEILEIDDFESTKSTQITEKNLKNTPLPPSSFSYNKQHNKLYIAFCCLRIHLA